MIRIVIADDHTLVRDGLKQILAEEKDFAVVGEAQNGLEVMQTVRDTDFDVLVLDLSMPGRSGPELIKQIHAEKPQLRILVLTMHQEPQYAVRAIRSGAAGYLTKECASTELVSAIRKVANGGAYLSAEAAEQLALGSMPDAAAPPHGRLSNREFEVFQLLVSGEAVTHIAGQLNLSVKTISTHKAHIMRKLGLQNHTDMVRYAIHHRLID